MAAIDHPVPARFPAPPPGARSRALAVKERVNELAGAIGRYAGALETLPHDALLYMEHWAKELADRVSEYRAYRPPLKGDLR